MQARLPSDQLAWVAFCGVWLSCHCARMRAEVVKPPVQSANNDVRLAGGLTVLQCGVAPSLRVEKQMRGRAGRQGDPGQSFAVAHYDDPSLRRHFPDAHEVLTSPRIRTFESTMPVRVTAAFQSQVLDGARRRSVVSLQETLRRGKELDETVDAWRTLVDKARLEVLRLRRDQELQMFEQILRIWLIEWLQAPRPLLGDQLEHTSGETAQKTSVSSPQTRTAFDTRLAPLVDAGKHPSEWALHAGERPSDWDFSVTLACLLDPIVDPPGNLSGGGALLGTYLLYCRRQMQRSQAIAAVHAFLSSNPQEPPRTQSQCCRLSSVDGKGECSIESDNGVVRQTRRS